MDQVVLVALAPAAPDVSTPKDSKSGLVANFDLRTLAHSSSYRECTVTRNGFAIDSLTNPTSFVAYSGPVGAIQVYGAKKERAVDRFFGHAGISCLDAKGDLIVAGFHDGSIVLWDRRSGDVKAKLLSAHISPIAVLRLSADGRLVVSAGRDVILVHDVVSLVQGNKRPYMEICKHRKSVVDLHLGLASGLHARLWSASEEGAVFVTDLVDGATIAHVTFPSPISCMAVNAVETLCFVGSPSAVFVVDFGGFRQESEMLLRTPVDCVAMSIDDRYLVTGHDSMLTLWDIFTRQPLRCTDVGSVLKGSQIASVSVCLRPSPLATAIPETGILKHSISENTHALGHTRIARHTVVKPGDAGLQSKYDDLKTRFEELEALNNELCQLVESSRQ